jgi:hypothetical protein
MSRGWQSVLELNERREIVAGSETALCDAIRRGADLRIYTEFRNNEHLDVASDNPELVQEVSDFRCTYLLEDRWVAGHMTLRMPIEPPKGFGPRASMSFFMYNQNGQQAVARPYLDGHPAAGRPGPAPLEDHRDMPKYHQQDSWDKETNAPSSNFIYDFGAYRFLVRDEWEELLAHTSEGRIVKGSIEQLAAAFTRGCEIKVGIRGLCADLAKTAEPATDHEVFIQTGPGYFCTERRLFTAGSHPLVRVAPAIPLRYRSGNWDFGWLMPRTDSFTARWLCDPYTLSFRKSESRYAIRWFAR